MGYQMNKVLFLIYAETISDLCVELVINYENGVECTPSVSSII